MNSATQGKIVSFIWGIADDIVSMRGWSNRCATTCSSHGAMLSVTSKEAWPRAAYDSTEAQQVLLSLL